MSIKTELIIFDLDGTLVNSCEDIRQALNHCFTKRGIQGFSYEEVRQMVGEGVNRLIEKAMSARNVSMPIQELLECFVSYYNEHIADFSQLYPDVKETLEALKDFKKVVISNKLTALTIKTMEHLDILKYFDFVAGSDTFVEKKPSPLPIFETIKRFNTSPERTIIVGDSDIDIQTGRAAGVKVVAVTYGYRDRELLQGADFMIDSISALKNIILVRQE